MHGNKYVLILLQMNRLKAVSVSGNQMKNVEHCDTNCKMRTQNFRDGSEMER